MQVLNNISLKKYNTFGLDYIADCFIQISTEEEAISLFKNRNSLQKPVLIIGGGSNILFTKDFKGTILHPEMGGTDIEKQDSEQILVYAGAGVVWDKFIEWTVDKGFFGLENLSLIPGTVGASAVQNIGAYGAEVKDVIEKVRAISLEDGSIREFSNNECRFAYRNSIFKNELKGKYLITKVYYKLKINSLLKPEYGSLNEEIVKLGELSLKNVRQAVINIRKSKLPDPELIGNAGSFFKNPVTTVAVAASLKNCYPDMPSYPDPSGGIKLAAGWLIEQCGWKGKRIGDAGVHDKQALVLVNLGNATGKEILELSNMIMKSVSKKFGIDIDREVEVI